MAVQRNTNLPGRALLDLLERRAPRPLSIQEIAGALQLVRYDRKKLKADLEAQVAAKALRRVGKTRYQWVRPRDRRPTQASPSATHRGRPTGIKRSTRNVEGVYARVRAGYGFVEVLGRAAERFPRDLLIPEGMEGAALHGDRVLVEILGQDRRARRVTGRVVEVKEQVHERILGTLRTTRGRWWVVPENELLPPIDVIGGTRPQPGEAGRVALLRLTRRAAPGRPWGGELERVIGNADDPEVQFLTITFEHGLRTEFPEDTLAEAERLPTDPDEADWTGRADLRELPFVTIDGETARDFDDAVCLEPLPRRGYRLQVAIADVSHYVRPGTALDREAARRGTSVYFPDRAIPMLPERLSNELCSLNPNRNRLVIVAELTYDRSGQRRNARVYRAVIRSRARLTYTQVAAMLSAAHTPEIDAWRTSLASLLPQLRLMHELMRLLSANRVRAGSLDLDLPETLVDISEEGRSLGLRLFQRNDAHRLIEEFMLEANCAVALHLQDHEIPLPYRVHEPPDPADIDDLNDFLGAFGLLVRYDGKVLPQDVQRLLDAMKGHPLARVLSRLTLRALKQARYATDNTGHFGLAFPVYCHFTSPIRRYPDLIVHRQLGRFMDGQTSAAQAEAAAIEEASIESSQRERQAMEAERSMLDLRKAEFMTGHLLEPEPGTIISVLRFGFFVELDAYPVEGLVRIDSLAPDHYLFDERRHTLTGRRSGARYRLGDRVLVAATSVSLRRREIDLELLEMVDTKPQRGTAPGNRRRRRR